jgi:N,N-dimethylformamidase
MQVIGYTDRLSVRQGESVKFMVSCLAPQYEASLVRLIHGDTNPIGPGFKEERIASTINKTYRGREQRIYLGSYVSIPDSTVLNPPGSFTLQAWIYPTTPMKGVQGLMTKWDASESGSAYGLFINDRGELAFWIRGEKGAVHRVSSGQPMRAKNWYFAAAAYDAAKGTIQLWQQPVAIWPNDTSRVHRQEAVAVGTLGKSSAPFLIAAHRRAGAVPAALVDGLFNGKIDGPKVLSGALGADEISALAQLGEPSARIRQTVIASWDFSQEIASARAIDTSANKLHGSVINMPARAMTGRNWSGRETDFKNATSEYGAIYFHDDDLDDAGWDCDFDDFDLRVPGDLPSGVYAARLQAGESFDYVPFFVRPAGKAQAKTLFLVPTFSYMAYGNEHLPSRPGRAEKQLKMSLEELLGLGTPYEQALFRYMDSNRLTSFYEFHSDGSGVAYTTRLRPLANLRPLYRKPATQFKSTHQFNEDLYLVDWLTAMGHDFDIATDEDLHSEGKELLAQYRVILTGSHPEYWSGNMYSALEDYLNEGGRLMYLGGNGFYWVTSVDPARPHIIEIRRSESGVRTWQADPGEYFHSTSGELGGLWRYRNKTPQRIVGIGMTATGGEPARPYRRLPPSKDPRAAFMFEGIGETEIMGDFGLHMTAAAGWELDRADPALGTPHHALVVATSFGHSDSYQLTVEEMWKGDPTLGGTRCPDVRADIVFFEYPNGGAVFSVGSISYCGSLSPNNYKNNISRLTHNTLIGLLQDVIPVGKT